MATTTMAADFLGRALVTPDTAGKDHLGRAILADDLDFMGRDLVADVLSMFGGMSAAPEDTPETFTQTVEPTQADTFDPGDYTVPEVLDYIAANPDQEKAVLRAERKGKNRTGITGG